MSSALELALAALSPEHREAVRSAAMADAWRRLSRGELTCDFVLHKSQREAAKALRISEASSFYLNVARQWGKSTMLLALLLERGWAKPGSLWLWWAPFRDDAVDVVDKKARILLADCPAELWPELDEKDVVYRLPNGSEIQFHGANNKHARFARGRTVHGVVIDEAAEIDELPMLVDAICLPMLLHSGGPIWLSSTPAILAEHPSYEYVRACLSRGDGFTATVHDNPLLTPKQVSRHMEAAGGEESATWRREYLAQLDVTDPDAVLVPEFGRLKGELVRPWERPPLEELRHLRRYVGIDPGIEDRTGLVFATYDFVRATIRAQSSQLLRRATTDAIREACELEEKRLWPGLPPPKRIADDSQGRLVADLCDNGFIVEKAIKDDRKASINLLRTFVAKKRLTLEPDAGPILHQLEHAHIERQRLARNLQGHYDAFDALLYLVRTLDGEKGVNPLPPEASRYSHTRPKPRQSKVLELAFGKASHRKKRV